MKVASILDKLNGVTESANGWQAKCPAHDDHRPSLSIKEGDDGRILLNCHAGCSPEAVCDTLGIKMADLYLDTPDGKRRNRSEVAAYDYTDESGKLLFQVVRFQPKDFRQRRPDPTTKDPWIWNMKGIRRVLFRLPQLLEAVKGGRRVFIVEGEKDVLALIKVGLTATCNPGGAGKWKAAFNESFRDANVVVIADNDQVGRKHAHLVASKLLGIAKRIRLIELPDREEKQLKDAADFFQVGGTADELRTIVESAAEFTQPSTSAPKSSKPDHSLTDEYLGAGPEGELDRLAALPLLDYEIQRNDAAEKLGFRKSVLDQLVQSKRGTNAEGTPKNSVGQLEDVEPYADPVDGAALLTSLRDTLRRYIVAPDLALSTCALFALHTYAFDLGDISPILFITGPTKRCGKSRTLSVLARLVNRPLTASSASPAAIYRTIELSHPTLLIDEVDSFMRGDEQLRGLINSGHTRDAAFHLCCVASGDDFEPRRWSTWTPKIFSGIGRLADTIEDRAFIIPMRRRRRDEPVERLRHGTRFEELRSKCARFVADHSETIREADPRIPEALNDRAADNWTPLFALADIVGGHWPETARHAALELSGGEDGENLDIKELLLADIQKAFKESQTDRLTSHDLCRRLSEIEDHPWAEYGRSGKTITPNKIAKLLKSFGIRPRNMKTGSGDVRKGYFLADFDEAFASYLPSEGISIRYPATTPENKGDSRLSQPLPIAPGSDSENAENPEKNGDGSGVAVEKPGDGAEVPIADLVEELI